MYNRVELMSVRAYSETTKEFGRSIEGRYLEIIYEAEDDHGVYEIIYPKVDLCLPENHLPMTEASLNSFSIDIPEPPVIKWAAVEMPLRSGSGEVKGIDGTTIRYKNASRIIRTIKEKPVDMTLEEIEKKLGYKVKIVSEKK